MTVQAYILIQTEVGKAAQVAGEIAGIKGVTMAEDVTGPYDVIVRAEARNVDELGKLVVARIQGVAGITRTLTCPVVHLWALQRPSLIHARPAVRAWPRPSWRPRSGSPRAAAPRRRSRSACRPHRARRPRRAHG